MAFPKQVIVVEDEDEPDILGNYILDYHGIPKG